ncbi:MAG: hypothetical protein KF799_14170, partial [Bdellovibrionales bacterium]|nr:hypothetical protein [Bdellovibrionales bacterium]
SGMNLPLRVQNLNTTNGASTGIGFKVATTSGDQHFKSAIVFHRVANGGLGNLNFLLSTDTGSTNVSLSDSRMLLTREGQLAIGAGTTSSSNAGLDVATTGTALSSIIIPRDSTTNRPLTPVNGMIRYNTTDAKFEFYQNGAWVNYGTGSGGGSVTWPLAANPAVTSASAPSFSFTGDTNTGLYSPSAGQINLTTDGTARLAVTSQGYVGVGTTNPLQTLHITDNASGIQLGTPGTGAFDNVGISILTAKGDNHLLGWNGGEKGWQLMARGDANTVNTLEQNDLQFTYYEAGTWTSTLFLDHLGKIGIGTSTPTVGLDVATTGTAGSGIVVPRDSTANRPPGVNGMIRYNTSDAKFEFYQNGAWVNYGTGSGGSGVSFPILASPGTTPPSAPSYSFTSDTDTGLLSQALGTLGLATNGTTRMTVNATGQVGIGTTAPNSTLEVAGTLRLSGTTSESFVTPGTSSVPTKINVPVYDPGAYGQIVAMGIPSTTPITARVITLADARTAAHQPTLAILSPDEAQIMGLTWDGSNTVATMKSTKEIGFNVNGSEAMHIGYGIYPWVGINTNQPAARLHINAVNSDVALRIGATMGTGSLGAESIWFSNNSDGGKAVGKLVMGGLSTNNNDFRFSTGSGSYGSEVFSERLTIRGDSGQVGIGTSNPRAALDVNGTIVGKSAVSNATTTIDFSTGNTQYTALQCQTFALWHMQDGASYTLAIQNGTSATCVFNAYSAGGTGGLTFHYPPDHAATTSTKHTIYTFIVIGSHVYASWVPGL